MTAALIIDTAVHRDREALLAWLDFPVDADRRRGERALRAAGGEWTDPPTAGGELPPRIPGVAFLLDGVLTFSWGAVCLAGYVDLTARDGKDLNRVHLYLGARGATRHVAATLPLHSLERDET